MAHPRADQSALRTLAAAAGGAGAGRSTAAILATAPLADGLMRPALSFQPAPLDAAASGLDTGCIHLWRIPYRREQGRTPLLQWLAAYLGAPATGLALRDGTHGKPRLADTALQLPGAAGLEFNWSHSGAYALVALAREVPLGVDIESLDRRPRVLEIASRYFDPTEAAGLAALEPSARRRAFISLWCSKEAVLKAAGVGLSFGLARLAFEHVAEDEWALRRADPALGDVAAWRVAGFAAAPGYRAALAWHGGPRRIVALRPTDDCRS